MSFCINASRRTRLKFADFASDFAVLRTLVGAYHAAVDFSDPKQIARLVNVYLDAIDSWGDEGIEPVELAPSRGMLQQWGVEGLSREQNIRLRERLWPLREHYLAERRARIERNKASKRLAAEAAGAKLWADANF
jgi:hypothetical protein